MEIMFRMYSSIIIHSNALCCLVTYTPALGIEFKIRSSVFIWSPLDPIHFNYVALEIRFERINT